jgi:hypothetical protein
MDRTVLHVADISFPAEREFVLVHGFSLRIFGENMLSNSLGSLATRNQLDAISQLLLGDRFIAVGAFLECIEAVGQLKHRNLLRFFLLVMHNRWWSVWLLFLGLRSLYLWRFNLLFLLLFGSW